MKLHFWQKCVLQNLKYLKYDTGVSFSSLNERISEARDGFCKMQIWKEMNKQTNNKMRAYHVAAGFWDVMHRSPVPAATKEAVTKAAHLRPIMITLANWVTEQIFCTELRGNTHDHIC